MPLILHPWDIHDLTVKAILHHNHQIILRPLLPDILLELDVLILAVSCLVVRGALHPTGFQPIRIRIGYRIGLIGGAGQCSHNVNYEIFSIDTYYHPIYYLILLLGQG